MINIIKNHIRPINLGYFNLIPLTNFIWKRRFKHPGIKLLKDFIIYLIFICKIIQISNGRINIDRIIRQRRL